MKNDRTNPYIYFAPKWIYQALVRNGSSLESLTQASVIKGCASTKELTELVELGSMIRINGNMVANLIQFEGVTAEGEDLNALCANVTVDADFRQAIISSLSTPEGYLGCETPTDKCYDFVMTSKALVIVINPGFMTQVQNADFSKEFLRNLVMTLGGTLSVDKLASYPFYGSYLRTLRA